MRSRALPFVVVLLLSGSAYGQATWQPTAPPLVTAENTTWFQRGDPITWNGDFYYPVGAQQGFNQYQMVRSGSFQGIPLYTDTTLEPYSIVFVPLIGGRMQPYERRRTGALAGTTGSRAPSLPTDIGIEGAIPTPLPQALAPPTYARAYDLAAVEESPAPIRTAGSVTTPTPTGTAGRTVVAPAGPVTTAIPPTGANAIWINFDGRRWYAAGRSIEYDAARLNEIGSYKGWTVYALKSDPTRRTIYIPSTPGRLAPYRIR